MRRLLATLLLAGPLAAAAQTITATPTFVNASECSDTTNTVSLGWTTTIPSGGTAFAAGGTYTVYAATTQETGTTAPFCDETHALNTDPSPIDASSATVSAVSIKSNDILTALSVTCPVNAKVTYYLCAEWVASGGSAASGYARGSLLFDTTVPNAPTVANVYPGDSALVVDVTDNGGTATATTWEAKAVNAADSTDVHYSSWSSTTTGIRVEGLVNGTDYFITAYAKADNENESLESSRFGGTSPTDPSATKVQPQVVLDFFDAYRNAGGRDSGGCDAGPAGLLALLGAASLLRLRRRS